jgi:ribosomal protein L11 methyltransferase
MTNTTVATGRAEDGGHFTLRVSVDGSEQADIASAEAWAAGAVGIEELATEAEGMGLLVYAPAVAVDEVLGALASVSGARVGEPQRVEEVDWADAWKHGIRETVVSERLVIRPSFVDVRLAPGQLEVVVDPGQAFGTGGHSSTLLALEWIDALVDQPNALDANTSVLDVGSGTGVLALAALQLGADRALGFDIDAIAVTEAARCARENGLHDRLQLFAGPLDALAEVEFDLILANLLRSEMLPLVDGIARRTALGGSAILSGLLCSEEERVLTAFASVGFEKVAARTRRDDTDDWLALWLRKTESASSR